jgi:C-terminal processing protease CtpA/Prc
LAIAEWLTPNGHRIWHRGIAPDLDVESPDEVDLLLPGSDGESADALLSQCKDRQLLKGIEVCLEHIQSQVGSDLVAMASK